MSEANPICVALDTPDLDRARALAKALKPHVGYLKIGMEFFYAHGAKGYEAVAAEGLPIFLDLKLHDIPNTVAEGMRSLMRLSPSPAIINLHASGGMAMMQAAAEAVGGARQAHCRDPFDQPFQRRHLGRGLQCETGYGRPRRRTCKACQSRRAGRRCLQLP